MLDVSKIDVCVGNVVNDRDHVRVLIRQPIQIDTDHFLFCSPIESPLLVTIRSSGT